MPTKRTQRGFYAVRTGRKTGVFETWADCEKQITGFPKAKYKKFATFKEAEYFALGVPSPEASNADASTSDSSTDSKTKKRSRSLDVEDVSEWDVVYCDGACKGNGKVGAVAGIGIWWGPDDSRNLAERCPGDQTNNRAELIAILRVLETTPISTKPLLIKSDSRYSIDCLKTWIFKWKKNGFRTGQGEAVKNAGIIRCTSIQLDIRARFQQKIRLQYVKGHSGNIGNDGADAMANKGALLPPVEELDWEAIESKLLKLLEQSSVETSDVEPVPTEVHDIDDVVGNTAVEIRSSKMRRSSSDFHEQESGTTMAVANLKPTPYSTNLLPESAPHDEMMGVARPQVMLLESPATVSQTDFETIRDKKISLKVICALPPFVPVKHEEVNFDDYMDCILDDGDLAKELSD